MVRILGVVSLCFVCSVLQAQQPDNGSSDDGQSQFDPCETVDGSIFKPLTQIRTVIADDGMRLPPDCSVKHFNTQSEGSQSRFALDTAYHWEPTNFFHMPAYLDDVPLERYGQSISPHFQPVISGVRFGLQLPMLPYKMGVDCPHDCISTLGHRPPGDCVPCIRQRLPLEADAALIEAAAVVGTAAILP